MTSGGPTQTALSLTRAAGKPPISTMGQHGGKIGPPTCGTGPFAAGQACMSFKRAAGCPISQSSAIRLSRQSAFFSRWAR